MKNLLALALLIFAVPAFGAAPVKDAANVTSSHTYSAGSVTQSATVGASDNLLLVGECSSFSSGTGHAPDTVTYNGTSLTLVNSYVISSSDCSLWYLSSPPSGSHTLTATWTTNTNISVTAVISVPFSGAATSSIFGTPSNNFSTSDNNPTVTVTGGTSNSIYVAETWNGTQTTTSAGTGQTDIANIGSIGAGSDSIVMSSIPGSDTGAFTWTGGGTGDVVAWWALGVNINGGSGGTCTHSGITSAGAIATPSGTSGSYRGKSGAFVPPDCSTINYKQPTIGNFGVN